MNETIETSDKFVWKLDVIIISWLEIDVDSGQPRMMKRKFKDETKAQYRIDRLLVENPTASNIQKKICYKLVENESYNGKSESLNS